MRADEPRSGWRLRTQATNRRARRREPGRGPAAVALEDVPRPWARPTGALAAGLLAWGLLAAPVLAGVCSVPGTHASIQAAIDDPGCMVIELAGQTYDESIHLPRSLTLAGPGGGGAVVAGLAQVVGPGTAVALVDLAVRNGCPLGALLVHQGAQVSPTNLEVEHSEALPCPPSPLFADGFESGDTSAWSTTVQ